MNHPIHPGPGACPSELLQYIAELADNQLDPTSTLCYLPALDAIQHAVEDLRIMHGITVEMQGYSADEFHQ